MSILIMMVTTVLLIAVYFGYHIASHRQADHYIKTAYKQRQQILKQVKRSTPADIDLAFLTLDIEHGWLTPLSRKYIKSVLWTDLTQQLSRQAVKQWKKNGNKLTSENAFAIHAFMDHFGLLEVLADANVYYALPVELRNWLDSVNHYDHLKQNVRRQFKYYIESAGEKCKLDIKGFVTEPVDADIYCLKDNSVKNDLSHEADNTSIIEQWAVYKQWLNTLAPELLNSLKPAADQLHKFEQELGVSLLLELKQFYSLHNGQAWESPWVFPDGQWLSLGRVHDIYLQCRQALDEEWNANWFPIIFDGGSSYIVFDNSNGCLVNIWFDMVKLEPLADSIADWLTYLNASASQGLISFDADMQHLLIKNNDIH